MEIFFSLDQSPLQHLLREQITDLMFLCRRDTHIVSKRAYKDEISIIAYSTPLFLRHLPLTTCSSQVLRKLCVRVNNFEDCLALLDGRLGKLTLTLTIIVPTFITKSKFFRYSTLFLKSFFFEMSL